MLKKYFQEYDSEQDEDYNPTKQEEAIYRQQHQKKKKVSTRGTIVKDLWEELQEQFKATLKKRKPNEQGESPPNSVQMAQKILNSSSIKPDKKIMFAGKQYLMNEQTGQLQMIEKVKPQILGQKTSQEKTQQNQQILAHRKTKLAYQYLNHVMQAIYNRSRKINAVGKSKLDWKGFVKQEGIEDKLSYNRKGGVIQDLSFMKKKR